MSETRKVNSTLEPIRLVVTLSTLTPLVAGAIGRVRLVGSRRVNRVHQTATIDEDITAGEPSPGVSGWTLDEETQAMTITFYSEEDSLPLGIYGWEIWIYDTDDDLVLKVPGGRPVLQEMRKALPTLDES